MKKLLLIPLFLIACNKNETKQISETAPTATITETKSTIENVKKGMSRDEVIAAIGNPEKEQNIEVAHIEMLIYKDDIVVLQNGKVVNIKKNKEFVEQYEKDSGEIHKTMREMDNVEERWNEQKKAQ